MTPPDPLQAADGSVKGRVLDPIERLSEIVFGLIMALSFTGSLSVATAAREEVREMLVGAIGCNIAWGIVDGVMYVLTRLIERGRGILMLRAVQQTSDPARARGAIAGTMPEVVASALKPEDLERIRLHLVHETGAPPGTRPTLQDLRGAIGVFLLVFLSTLPVALPFALFSDAHRAMRVSNGIAVGLLFLGGVLLGRYSGLRPIRTGLGMVAIGVTLVAITLALGG